MDEIRWYDISQTIGGYSVDGAMKTTFPYDDGTPCYTRAEATVKLLDTRPGMFSTRTYVEREYGVDFNEDVWVGEVGAVNQMAEYLSNGWDRFFVFYSNDYDEVVNEVENYIWELLG